MSGQHKGKKIQYATQNGIFFYDHFDSIARLEEQKSPTQDELYGKLDDRKCTESEYRHIQQVWEVFEMETLKDLHDLYLKSDVLLPADFLKNFVTCV